MADRTLSTAGLHGPRWGRRAAEWADYAAGLSAPAWQAVARAAGVSEGMSVLDVGCGSGEFCKLAADRGATVSGIDAAEGMIEVARARVPGADLRVGPIESLPWPDDQFDLVTAFNSLQFTGDFGTALGEAQRVARPGGRVAVCNWGRRAGNEMFAVVAAVRDLYPPPPRGPPPPDPPALGEPGVLEELAAEAGLQPVATGDVDVPLEAPDEGALVKAMLAPGAMQPAIAHSGEEAVRARVVEASEPFRLPDGSYRMRNRFRYLIAAA